MKSLLPSKKIIISILFALLVLIIGFFALGYGEKYLKYLVGSNLADNKVLFDKSKLTENTITQDSDNDGLMDWEEVLWNTDINNPDTDGDGTADGEEVRADRDPLKVGPDDKFVPKVNIETFTNDGLVQSGGASSVNLTELFSKSLVFQAGNEINPLDLGNQGLLSKVNDSTEKILKDFIASFNPVLSENEFNVSDDNSKVAIIKYNKELEMIFSDIAYPKKTEGEVFIEVAKGSNVSLIDPYIDYYKKHIIRMKQITVPSSFINDHKQWVESLIASLHVNESMKEIESDPLRTIIAMQENERIKNEFTTFIIGFGEKISKLIK